MEKVIQTFAFGADRRNLATLFDVSAEDQDSPLWQTDEFGAILRHQLAAPIRIDLDNLERLAARNINTSAESSGLALKSFGDLLEHPHPPIELLGIAKNFAKACRISPRGHIPSDVATVLYFACIAAALTRCWSRITGLSNAELADGFRWTLARPWLDDKTCVLINKALAFLDTCSETEEGR